MVLLPDERAWGALTFAKRFQTELARHRTAPLVSCGIAEADRARRAPTTLVRQADLALYEAKRSGRKIVVYSAGLDTEAGRAGRRDRGAPPPAARRDRARAGRRRQGRRHPQPLRDRLRALRADRPVARALDDERVEQLRLAGLLHDVGKIGIADAVLRKPGRLDPDERTR